VATGENGRMDTTGLPADVVTLVEGSSFCISTTAGEIHPGSIHGMFHRDTRIVSSWSLRLDGHEVEPLAVITPHPNQATFLGRGRPGGEGRESTLLVRRERYVGAGMREDIILHNLAGTPARLTLEINADADFADLFAVKEGRVRKSRPADISADQGALQLDSGASSTRGVRIKGEGAQYAPGSLAFRVTLPARGTWQTRVQVLPTLGGKAVAPSYPLDHAIDRAEPTVRRREWAEHAPVAWGADESLLTTLLRSERDLGSLRIFDPDHPEQPAVAAGAPWFMALFGRDSLLSAYMSLSIDQNLALGTLRTLARHQGARENAASEEQPGRIVHEMRFGEEASLVPHSGSLYYGTVDATPLFVVLLGELSKWGLSESVLLELLPNADRALEWIESYGDPDGDGFLEYRRMTDHGLRNQGWKDSWDGINFADGRLAEPPIALCEAQGYVYAAYRARAQLARRLGQRSTAATMDARAKLLKERFNQAFWLPERGWYAVGLDRGKQPIDSLTSNIGQCMWTGIVDQDKAEQVADNLLGPQMFSGWGVRTLGTAMGAYNPLSYHNGSVWPHDNALIATGLMHYGFVEYAHRVAEAILTAAEAFGGRLPELFTGLGRDEFPAPVAYPGSCSPQAWASAAPLQLMRTLLRFDPNLPDGTVRVDPALPSFIPELHIDNIPLGPSRIRISVTGTTVEVDGLPPGVRVISHPSGRPEPPDAIDADPGRTPGSS
jgi:glycogen debranching enzyme